MRILLGTLIISSSRLLLIKCRIVQTDATALLGEFKGTTKCFILDDNVD